MTRNELSAEAVEKVLWWEDIGHPPKAGQLKAVDDAIRAAVAEERASLMNDVTALLEQQTQDRVRAAVALELEMCAKLAEELEAIYEVRDYADPEAKAKGGYAAETKDFAAALRARGNQ